MYLILHTLFNYSRIWEKFEKNCHKKAKKKKNMFLKYFFKIEAQLVLKMFLNFGRIFLYKKKCALRDLRELLYVHPPPDTPPEEKPKNPS